MGKATNASALSGYWRGTIHAMYGELVWHLRWRLEVSARGELSGEHRGWNGEQRRRGALRGFVRAGSTGHTELCVVFRDQEGWLFAAQLAVRGSGRGQRLAGPDELSTAESEEEALALLKVWRKLAPTEHLVLCEECAGREWFDPGTLELRRETELEKARRERLGALRAALRSALPEGARALRTVVGQRRHKKGGWEVYARAELEDKSALSHAERAPSAAEAANALLAKLRAR